MIPIGTAPGSSLDCQAKNDGRLVPFVPMRRAPGRFRSDQDSSEMMCKFVLSWC
ncbi:hypothetical protein K456DRAFT_1154439 [Colletotrichum gloeosporioides 23]|nr:hypothetical protein K456DRAFT_1154439 [Colletotrichum gloeosporioides 23]